MTDLPANQIECPNCGQLIDVNELLYHQVEETLKRRFSEEAAKQKHRYDELRKGLDEERSRLEQEREKQAELVAKTVAEQVRDRQAALTEKIRKQLADEQGERLAGLETEIREKSEQLKEFNKARADIERLKREKDELKDAIEAESERRLSARLAEERAKIQKLLEERTELKVREKDQVIEQLSSQLKEAQRKAEQGSMQLQGEVLELVIEEWLTANFPLDTIEEIKKGARGADCLQTVNEPHRPNCGTIYYESKRAKDFQPAWIEKFKADIRERGADIGVLVTQSWPTGMERMGQRDGIWICSYDEFKSLSAVLRDSLVRLSDAGAAQVNRGDKMNMLYDYLTSNEFRLQIEGIVEGFTQMQTELESEKRAMQQIWKKREKQIQKVLLNTNHMYGSVKGIAGSAIGSVPLLEMPEDED